MTALSYHTAGESHGPAVVTLVNGLPAGLRLDVEFINAELRRRQGGYGRGGRQKIESDAVTFLAGVRLGQTTGGPLVMQTPNRDSRLDDLARTPVVSRPRPGHADLAGSVKWLTTDCRNALERASARETVGRTAAGAVARCLLREFGITTFGFVRGLLDAVTDIEPAEDQLADLIARRDASAVYCPDETVGERIIASIRQAKIDKDTVGGLAEVHVFGVPIGLGSCAHWDQKLDGRLAGAVMSIQAFKAVEIGLGLACATRPGSKVHDPISWDPGKKDQPSLGFSRPTNNAGGLEGGMTNGMPIVVRAAMKPISTLLQGMPSVDLNTKKAEQSTYERSDVCALPAASVVMENVVAFEVARAFTEKFAADTMRELGASYRTYLDMARQLPLETPAGAGSMEADQTEA
ncbi:MAG: chorismate synthase [Planctomycetota bacterium]|nr:MAG: chorismate synthase [Planctomycetota bacterium]